MNIVRFIPNTLTSMNLVSGCVASTMALQGNLFWAMMWIIIASVFDFSDGLAARLLKAYSPLGKELDSLADVVSFGVAPGMILYTMLGEWTVAAGLEGGFSYYYDIYRAAGAGARIALGIGVLFASCAGRDGGKLGGCGTDCRLLPDVVPAGVGDTDVFAEGQVAGVAGERAAIYIGDLQRWVHRLLRVPGDFGGDCAVYRTVDVPRVAIGYLSIKYL